MSKTEKFRSALLVLELTLWALTAIYIIFGGPWWHFSGAAAGAVVIRALRMKYYGKPPHDEQEPTRKSNV